MKKKNEHEFRSSNDSKFKIMPETCKNVKNQKWTLEALKTAW